MSGGHYFIERTHDGRFIAKEKGEGEPSASFATQEEAIAYARSLNPHDHPDVERVRNTEFGGRDQWRSAR